MGGAFGLMEQQPRLPRRRLPAAQPAQVFAHPGRLHHRPLPRRALRVGARSGWSAGERELGPPSGAKADFCARTGRKPAGSGTRAGRRNRAFGWFLSAWIPSSMTVNLLTRRNRAGSAVNSLQFRLPTRSALAASWARLPIFKMCPFPTSAQTSQSSGQFRDVLQKREEKRWPNLAFT